MVPVRRFRARDLREHERQSVAPSRANAAPRTHRESKLPREPTIEGIVPVRLFCCSHRCSRLFNKPSSSGMRPVILLSWMSLPQEENNEHTRAQESERECSHRVFRSEHLAIAAGMVPVSSPWMVSSPKGAMRGIHAKCSGNECDVEPGVGAGNIILLTSAVPLRASGTGPQCWYELVWVIGRSHSLGFDWLDVLPALITLKYTVCHVLPSVSR